MRTLQIVLVVTIFLYSCTEFSKSQFVEENNVDTLSKGIDSIANSIKVGSKPITHELAGSNYRKRAVLYFIVKGKDTSDFKCYVTESLEGKVGLELKFAPSMTYRRQMQELSDLLSEASKSFLFDSLQTIFLGRLISTGELAVIVSSRYKPDKTPVSDWLLTSKLREDFNNVLMPYKLSVASVSTEKVFWADKQVLSTMSQIEIDETVPDKILDALTWIRLKPL